VVKFVKTFRSNEVLGLPVLIIGKGENAGEVKDLIFDFAEKRLSALVLKSSMLSSAKAVLFDDIVTIGKDGVCVKSRESLVRAKNLVQENAVCGAQLRNSKVFCEKGKELGILGELIISHSDGRIFEIEISRGVLADISEGFLVLSGSCIKSGGKDFILLERGSEEEASQTGGAKELLQAVLSSGAKVASSANTMLLSQEARFALGKNSGMTIKDDKGDIMVVKGQKIEEEHIVRAKNEGKLHEFALAAGLSSVKNRWSVLKGEK